MAFGSPEQQREMLALSFEQTPSGYVYYHYRWSRGVPVSAAERESYLNIPALGSRRAWRKSIEGRPTVPHRQWSPTGWKLLAALPLSMAFIGALFGVTGIFSGVAEANRLLAALYIIAGASMLIFGGAIIVAHLKDRQATDG